MEEGCAGFAGTDTEMTRAVDSQKWKVEKQKGRPKATVSVGFLFDFQFSTLDLRLRTFDFFPRELPCGLTFGWHLELW